MASDRLKVELETYERLKNALVEKSEGKFVLIQGANVLGTWDTYEDALKDGYGKCGLKSPFLVKQVSAIEQIHFISHEFSACKS